MLFLLLQLHVVTVTVQTVVAIPLGIEYSSPIGEDKYIFSGTADNGGDSSHSYEVAFDLVISQFLFTFLRQLIYLGIKLDFSRNADNVVSMTYTLNGKTTTRNITADEEHVHLEIDVHNNETDAHVLMWNAHDEDEDHDHEGGVKSEGEDEEETSLALDEDGVRRTMTMIMSTETMMIAWMKVHAYLIQQL